MAVLIEQLVDRASRLASSGRWDEAERAWWEVLGRDAQHPRALFSLGVHALKRGDGPAARELLSAARRLVPQDLLVLMTLCAACRSCGDADGEREAIEAALAVDAYFLPALLAKGSWLERFGRRASAAAMFAHALQAAPPEPQWPAQLRRQLAHAREVAGQYGDELAAFAEAELGQQLASLPSSVAGRWREAASILAGRTKPYHAVANQLCVPRLPAVPFFEREQFPFLAALEAKTEAIASELDALLAGAECDFVPYIHYAPGEPVNQWAELNHSRKWSTLHLIRSGKPVTHNLARCPVTAEALAALPLADIDGLCPNAMFSVLAPHAHIPPHHGETNARVVAHLPLIVPEGCRYRVGFEQRRWRVGETLIFDDTIEHEAHNDSDELRVVLIFDLWNPFLEPAERDLVRTLAGAARKFAAAPSR